jgi:hypothetical protein
MKFNFKHKLIFAVFIFIVLLVALYLYKTQVVNGTKEHFSIGIGTLENPYTFDGEQPITLTRGGNYYIIVDDPNMPQPTQDEFPDISKFIRIPRNIGNVNNYINLGAHNILITGYSGHIGPEDGKRISVPNEWNGLIRNGYGEINESGVPINPSNEINGSCNSFKIKNIHIKCETILKLGGGGVCGMYFDHGIISSSSITNFIENCSYKGNVSKFGGGILGCRSIVNKIKIIKCFYDGDVIDFGGGGICGSECFSVGKSIITSCYSKVNILKSKSNPHGSIYAKPGAGGIAGSNICSKYITITSTSSNSIGVIIEFCYCCAKEITDFAGGICGYGANIRYGSKLTVSNCYFDTDQYDNKSPDHNTIGAILAEWSGKMNFWTNTVIKNCLWKKPSDDKFANIFSNNSNSKVFINDSHKNQSFDSDFSNKALLSIAKDSTSDPPTDIPCVWDKSVTPWKLLWETQENLQFSDKCPVIRIISPGKYVLTTDSDYAGEGTPIIVPSDDGPGVQKIPELTTDNYIDMQSNNIEITTDETINESNPIIVQNGWEGLFESNNLVTNISNKFHIGNIHIKCAGTLAEAGGGICRKIFANKLDSSENLIENCSFEGTIGKQGGGICGRGCGFNGGNITIQNCYSKGDIKPEGGGICGTFCGNTGTVQIKNCYSVGNINISEPSDEDSNNSAGGICGNYCGFKGNVRIQNCYSSGVIDGEEAGGICGENCGKEEGNVDIINCIYNSSGCESDTITITLPNAATVDIDQLNQVIGSIGENNGTINIINTGYFSTFKTGDLNNFNYMAEQTILQNPDGEGVLTDVWTQCSDGLWLLSWQGESDSCSTTFPVMSDPACTTTALEAEHGDGTTTVFGGTTTVFEEPEDIGGGTSTVFEEPEESGGETSTVFGGTSTVFGGTSSVFGGTSSVFGGTTTVFDEPEERKTKTVFKIDNNNLIDQCKFKCNRILHNSQEMNIELCECLDCCKDIKSRGLSLTECNFSGFNNVVGCDI